jgi:ADP-ribosylglycohydrolase
MRLVSTFATTLFLVILRSSNGNATGIIANNNQNHFLQPSRRVIERSSGLSPHSSRSQLKRGSLMFESAVSYDFKHEEQLVRDAILHTVVLLENNQSKHQLFLPEAQLNALVDFYWATNGSYWFNNSGWKENIEFGVDWDPCGSGVPHRQPWKGVTCNASMSPSPTSAAHSPSSSSSSSSSSSDQSIHNHQLAPSSSICTTTVISLDLESNNLNSAQLPSSLSQLSDLVVLNFKAPTNLNSIGGSTPEAICTMKKLKFLRLPHS